MSRVGIQALTIASGITLSIDDGAVTVKGSKGENSVAIPDGIKVEQDGDQVTVSRTAENPHTRAMHGTIRSLLSNAIQGVHEGFQRDLIIEGVGYRAALQGKELVLNLGFSHPINYPVPEGVDIKVDGQTALCITGIDKQKVGQAAARIRGFSPAEPYKGMGVRYKEEKVRRKVGKAVS